MCNHTLQQLHKSTHRQQQVSTSPQGTTSTHATAAAYPTHTTTLQVHPFYAIRYSTPYSERSHNSVHTLNGDPDNPETADPPPPGHHPDPKQGRTRVTHHSNVYGYTVQSLHAQATESIGIGSSYYVDTNAPRPVLVLQQHPSSRMYVDTIGVGHS